MLIPFPCVLPGSRVEFCQWCALVRCSPFCLTFLFVPFTPRHHRTSHHGISTHLLHFGVTGFLLSPIGVEWPPPKRRKVGKPSRESLYVRAIQRRLEEGKLDIICRWRTAARRRGGGQGTHCSMSTVCQNLLARKTSKPSRLQAEAERWTLRRLPRSGSYCGEGTNRQTCRSHDRLLACPQALLPGDVWEYFPRYLLFTERGTTSIIEPCDIAILRALKASVRRSWARAAAKDILNGADDVGNLLRTPHLRSDMVGLLHAGNSHADAYREGLEAPRL